MVSVPLNQEHKDRRRELLFEKKDKEYSNELKEHSENLEKIRMTFLAQICGKLKVNLNTIKGMEKQLS